MYEIGCSCMNSDARLLYICRCLCLNLEKLVDDRDANSPMFMVELRHKFDVNLSVFLVELEHKFDVNLSMIVVKLGQFWTMKMTIKIIIL